MREEKVTFKNSRDLNLVGILHIPNIEKPASVVMIHGLGGDKNEHGLFVNIAKKLCENGYMTLRFDCAGSGESDGKFRDVTRKTEAEDLRSAIEFIKKQNIDNDRICVIGLSLGASVSLIAYTPEIKVLVLMSSAILGNVFEERYGSNENYMQELKERGYFTKTDEFISIEISKKLFYEAKDYDWKDVISHIDSNILFIHGTNDDVVPLDYTKEAYKYVINGTLEIIEGAGHNYEEPKYEAKVIDAILFWMGEWL